MKVLWLSGNSLRRTSNSTGSWLYSMAEALSSRSGIKLVNVTVKRKRSILDLDYYFGSIEHYKISDRLEEYVLPRYLAHPDGGAPFAYFARRIKALIENINPDIIHCWGLECFYSRLMPDLVPSTPTLLEIQGLRYEYADFYRGDLSMEDIADSRDFASYITLGRNSVLHAERWMRNVGRIDNLCLSKYKFVSAQSDWVENVLKEKTSAKIFRTKMSVRTPFLTCDVWRYPTDGSINFFFSASSAIPYKGIQTGIKALYLVKKTYPNVRLKVAGGFSTKFEWNGRDYQRFILRLIKKLGLTDNIDFLGRLTAEEIVETQHKCIAAVQTSFIETYSLFNAEALCTGLPLISSYSGAMPELAKDGEAVLYYQPGDFHSCSSLMLRLIENKELACRLSKNAVSLNRSKHNPEAVANCQMKIYEEITTGNMQ